MNEVIVISLTTGVVALGMSFPIHKTLPKVYSVIITLVFIGLLTALMPERGSDGLVSSYKPLPSAIFLSHTVDMMGIASCVLLAIGCSFMYESMRKSYKNTPIKWALSKWWGIAYWAAFFAMSYFFYKVCGFDGTFFRCSITSFVFIATILTIIIIPVILFAAADNAENKKKRTERIERKR